MALWPLSGILLKWILTATPCSFSAGRRCDRIKALHHEKDGFCLLYKRLDEGRYQWPRNASEARELSRQEFRWLLEGLSVEQPRAIKASEKRDF